MNASTVAASVALVATIGIVFEMLELLRMRREICGQLNVRMVRLLMKTKFEATTLRLVEGPVGYGIVLLVQALAAVASVYALYYASPLAIVTTFMVGLGWILKTNRAPLGATGADMMQRIVWFSLLLFALAGGTVAQTAALVFIAFQGLFAYFIAGLSKLKSPYWQDGTAVAQVVSTRSFGLALSIPWGVSAFLTWSTLVFEIGGPFLVLLGPYGVLAFCGMALMFHASVAIVSGLPMFIFAFGATYPAIYWVVVQLQPFM